jgi:hypothetical protein
LPRWKKISIEASRQAEHLLEQLSADEVGCLYLDGHNRPVTPDPAAPEFSKLQRHFGSVRGAWPTIAT